MFPLIVKFSIESRNCAMGFQCKLCIYST